MLKRHKDLLRAVVTELRHALGGYEDASGVWQRGDLDRELERLGVAPDGRITPLDALPNPTESERRARYVADAQLASLKADERVAARAELVERAAYSWINRLLALRVMEARGLIDETLRSNPDYGGVSEALYLLRERAPERVAGPDDNGSRSLCRAGRWRPVWLRAGRGRRRLRRPRCDWLGLPVLPGRGEGADRRKGEAGREGRDPRRARREDPAVHRAVHGPVAPPEQPRPLVQRSLLRQRAARELGLLRPPARE